MQLTSYSEPEILLRSWNSSPDFHTQRLPPSSALTKSAIHSWGRDPTSHAQYTWNNHGYTHSLITSIPGCQSTLKPDQWWPLCVPPGSQTGWYYCPYWECQTLKAHQMKHLQKNKTQQSRGFFKVHFSCVNAVLTHTYVVLPNRWDPSSKNGLSWDTSWSLWVLWSNTEKGLHTYAKQQSDRAGTLHSRI